MALTRPGSGRGRGRGGEQGQRRARRKSAALLFAFFPCVALYRTKKRRKENFLPARQRPSPPRRPSSHLGRTLARSLKTLARRERAEKRRKSAERAIESRESVRCGRASEASASEKKKKRFFIFISRSLARAPLLYQFSNETPTALSRTRRPVYEPWCGRGGRRKERVRASAR